MGDAAWPSWVQSLPRHWARKRLKHVCSRYADYGLNEPATSYVSEGVRFLRTSDIDDAGALQSDGVYLPEELTAGCELQDGDILLSRSGTIGRSFRYRFDLHGRCSFAGYLIRYRPNENLDSDFAFYFTKSQPFAAWLSDSVIAATIGNVNGQKFANTPIGVPPRGEQQSIVAFLDRETARIDALVARKRRLLELLEEKRLAVITHAVTKGLDPNAPMKDSGIAWLGQIPAHWAVISLKHVARVQSGIAKGARDPLPPSIIVPYLRVANVQDGFLDLTDIAEIEIRAEDLDRYRLQAGDVLMNEGGDYDKLGRGTVWRGEIDPCIHQNHVFAVRCERIEPEWLDLITCSSYAKWHFILRSKQTTNLASISSTNLMELPVLVPPAEERASIREAVHSELRHLDEMAEKESRLIALLQEYRSALITNAVTGKIDVRGEVERKEAAE